jgi:hypothetical protein
MEAFHGMMEQSSDYPARAQLCRPVIGMHLSICGSSHVAIM